MVNDMEKAIERMRRDAERKRRPLTDEDIQKKYQKEIEKIRNAPQRNRAKRDEDPKKRYEREIKKILAHGRRNRNK